jgi:ubiquinone/menaquinone biosynthesis C-methylase UbiE
MNADSRNPQAALMADESMIRTLAAQTEAIWPQELPLLARYALGRDSRVLDAGCGTGEFSCRIARQYPGCAIIGVDVIEASLARARLLAAQHEVDVHFEPGDIYRLRFADDEFDLTACRHVLQAIPDAPAVIRELQRVTRPGGWIHLIAEDYAMLHMMSGPLDPDQFWQQGPINFAARTGTDARVGRRAWSYLHAAGLEEIRVD